jgi:hypothetical protein
MIKLNAIDKLAIVLLADYSPPDITLHLFFYIIHAILYRAYGPQHRVSMATRIPLFRFADWLDHSDGIDAVLEIHNSRKTLVCVHAVLQMMRYMFD